MSNIWCVWNFLYWLIGGHMVRIIQSVIQCLQFFTEMSCTQISKHNTCWTYTFINNIFFVTSDKTLKPHIVCIEKLWKDPDGEAWFHGNWFLRPNETFHLATRKFLEKVSGKDMARALFLFSHPFSLIHCLSILFKKKSRKHDYDHMLTALFSKVKFIFT